MRTPIRTILAATCIAGVSATLSACGGDSDSGSASSPSADDASRSTSPDAANGTEPDNRADTGSNGSSDFGIADTNWARSWAHLEVSGDFNRSLDIEGVGVTLDGLTNVPMATATNEAVNFTVDNDGNGALSMTLAEGATAGEFGTDCALELLDDSTDTKLHFFFTCNDLEAVSSTSTDVSTVTIIGDVGLEV